MTAITPSQLQSDLQTWLAAHDLDRGVTFYPQAKWMERGETMGADADLSLVMEGALLSRLLNLEWANLDGCDPADEGLYEEFCKLLDDRGYMHEVGFSWSAHFYPLEQWPIAAEVVEELADK